MPKKGGPLNSKSLINHFLLDILGDIGPIGPGVVLDPICTYWIPRAYGSPLPWEVQ